MRDTAKGFGVTFDGWQDGAGRLILAKRADGTYAASIGGVVISIPRQVGKTLLIGAVVFALCLLNPGLTVLWTAHRLKTANETFGKMQSFARRRKISPHVDKIVLGSGDEAIVFGNGSRILFGARERGFGRGFDDVDVVIFDEAQILTEVAIDDMVPAANAAANALVIFMGTPPKPTDPSEVFLARRADALSDDDEDTAYIEFSADPGCDPDDREQWMRANPSYPGRTSETAMLRLKKMLSAESFMREGLGVWDDANAAPWLLFPKVAWRACSTREEGEEPGWVPEPTYSVEMDPYRAQVAVGAAGVCREGGTGIEIAAIGKGGQWLLPWLQEQKITSVVMDDGDRSPTAPLAADLREAGIEVVSASFGDLKRSTGDLFDAVMAGEVVHRNHPDLDAAVANGTRRKSGDVWLIDRYGPGWLVNVVVLARHGHLQADDVSIYEERGPVEVG